MHGVLLIKKVSYKSVSPLLPSATRPMVGTFLLLQLVHLGYLFLAEELGVLLVILCLHLFHLLLVLAAHLRPAMVAIAVHGWRIALRTLTVLRTFALWLLPLYMSPALWSSTSLRQQLLHFALLTLIDGNKFLGGLLVQAHLLGDTVGTLLCHSLA